MKFLIDAQLPRKLAKTINDAEYRAIHTLLLPKANNTTDADINELSITEEWIVITKDSDFVDSFLLKNEPWKLLLISTGNIRNDELIKLFLSNIQNIAVAFETHHYIELSKKNLLIHQ